MLNPSESYKTNFGKEDFIMKAIHKKTGWIDTFTINFNTSNYSLADWQSLYTLPRYLRKGAVA